MFYQVMTILERPENQIKGIVSIVYNTSPNDDPTIPLLAWKGLKLRHSLPLRAVSMHACLHDQSNVISLVKMVVHLQPKRERVRTRFHFGKNRLA
jgi:hypothetical protein